MNPNTVKWRLAIVLILITVSPVFSQVTFERQIPGIYASDIVRHPSGAYYALTSVRGYPYFDYSVVRMSPDGDVIESHKIIDNNGPPYTNTFSALCIRKNGDIAAVGTENENNLVIFTCKPDFSNPVVKKISGTSSGSFKIVATANNGLAVLRSIPVAANDWHVQLISLDESLNTLFTHTFVENYLYPEEIFETSTGAFVLAGNIGTEGYVIRMSPGYVTKKFSGAENLRVCGATMINDELTILGTNGNKTTELVRFDAAGQMVSRNVIETINETVYRPEGFAMFDNGKFAYTRMYSDGRKGFDLIIYNAALEKINAQYFDRDFDWQNWTTFKTITEAGDGVMVLAQVSAQTIALKTDNRGVTGPPPPFTQIADAGIPTDGDAFYAWLDVDNDGRKELLVSKGNIGVYSFDAVLNKFKPVANPFPNDLTDSRGLTLGDYDNDGDLDVYVNRYLVLSPQAPAPGKNILFKNNGDGTFLPVTDLNINDNGSATLLSYWVDINNDGWLDLFTVNNGRDQAYLNNGDGTFLEMSPDNFETKTDWIYPTAYTWFDFNHDGYLDYVSHQNQQTDIMINVQGDHFEKHAFQEYFDIPNWNMPSNIGEFVPGYYQGKLCMFIAGDYGMYLEYENDIFELKPVPAGMEYRNAPRRGEFADIDNDGDLDLYLSGYGWDDIENDILNRNDNEKGFTYYRKYSGWVHKSFTFHDFDENSGVDLLGAYSDTRFMKNTSTGNQITFRLQGVASSTFGAGARVAVKSGGQWRYETVSMHAGHNGKVEYEALFRLGSAIVVDSLKIQWPSGCTTIRTGLPVNQTYAINEGCSGATPVVEATYTICAGDPIAIEITSDGKDFLWFKDLHSASIAATSATVVIDTLTQSTTFFVSNADSAVQSRKVPVHITVIPKPTFEMSGSIVGNNQVEFSITAEDEVVATRWFVNDELVSEEPVLTYTNTTGQPIQVCASVTFALCTVQQCEESFDTVTGTEGDVYAAFELFPNPFAEQLTLRSKSGNLFTVVLYDAKGRPLKEDSGRALYQFETRSLSPGLYFLRINQTIMMKVIRK